jgi:hypothetical protein
MATEVAIVGTSRARRVGFYIAVVLALALIVFGLGELLYLGIVGWLGESALEAATEPGAGPHLFHIHAHALFAWLLLITLAAQLRHPEQRVAAAVFGLAAMITYSLGTLVSGNFDPLEAVAILLLLAVFWLNPGREAATAAPFHKRALLASIPILAGGLVVAVVEVRRQVSGLTTDQHVEFGHHALVATLAVIVALAAVFGSSSLTGRRLVAGLAVGGLLYIGVASVLFPDHVSSLAVLGGVATIAAAVIYGWGAITRYSTTT